MIAVRPFSIHPNRSTEVKVRMIIDNFRIDLCPFNIMGVIRNAYFKHIKIKYLCYSDNARRCRKADLETSRLFYDRF